MSIKKIVCTYIHIYNATVYVHGPIYKSGLRMSMLDALINKLRLGLARGKSKINDIISFDPNVVTLNFKLGYMKTILMI